MIRFPSRLLAALTAATVLLIPAMPASAADPVHGSDRVSARPRCTVVYFDLGDVLVDTTDFAHLHYEEGALRQLRTLRLLGIPLGLITNVPPSWGSTDAERIERLKAFIAATWEEPEPFVWSYFGDRILLPRTDAERKPAPALFTRALERTGDCSAVYEGDSAEEVAVATGLGFRGYQVGVPDRPFYLPVWRVILG
ncbi:hypothetical protein R8Z50_26490 [Longispora sp. K20-0274]|uniref:hypothetical protein n=1 Tax=Longispora sp. K20-0274 TaxID=3088255 RepID=UPI00399B426D